MMLAILIVILEVIIGAWANQDVMKAFSYTFGLRMFECGEKTNYTQEMAGDILNYWNKEHPLLYEQTGCLVMCALKNLELTDLDGELIGSNAEAYARSTGADDKMVTYLIELYNKCHRRTKTIVNPCLAALEIAKCFRFDIQNRGWTPDYYKNQAHVEWPKECCHMTLLLSPEEATELSTDKNIKIISITNNYFVLCLSITLIKHLVNGDLFTKVTKSKEAEKDVRNSVFDFIIVGGGTAGCVLANRLSAVRDWKVLVLEAGDEENIDYNIPGVPTKDFRPILWNFRTERNGFSCLSRPGGSCEVKTGKVLGGSSLVNDMKYTRGTKRDYDAWHSNEEIGSLEWKFENLIEYFKTSEDNGDYDILMNSFYHSRGGEMHVQRFKYIDRHMEIFLGGFAELGFRSIDINTNAPEAAVNNQFVMYNNTRLSTQSAFLKPVRHRKNLFVKTKATVTKLIIDEQEKTIDGVLYEIEKGIEQSAYAKKETILTCGAINNVRLLHLSGIGPKDELKKYNISVIIDLPVGNNYQDQVTTGGLAFSLGDSVDVRENQVIEDFKTWFQNRGGPLGSRGIGQVSAFIQLYENKSGPNVELALEGNYVRSDKFMLTNVSVHTAEESNLPLPYYNLVNINPVLLKPKSKGKVMLNKRNPKYGRPVIQANLLKETEDLEAIIDSVDIALQLLNTKELKKAEIKLAPLDIFPCDRLQNRDQWNCIARHYTKALGNPIGTCRMGGNKTNSVVNYDLKVHGIERLRIVDASIMPSHIRGNIFAPAVMIAEKGSKIISRDWKENKSNFLKRK